jgi:hypothetical protein
MVGKLPFTERYKLMPAIIAEIARKLGCSNRRRVLKLPKKAASAPGLTMRTSTETSGAWGI